MVGKEIAARYRIDAEIGAGGMGTVFRGVDLETRQTVAIKHLKAEVAKPEIIERFKREGEALRELNHPNIVRMIDAIDEDDNHYLVMDYVAGGDLAKLIAAGGIDFRQVLKIAIDLADALTRAHKLKILHRDLKPANVLLADDGTLRLTDFGVAHVGRKDRLTDTSVVIGTLDYLPPEAFTESIFDERGDIWAFGVIIFEMLTGNLPFSGDVMSQVMYNILNEPLPDLENLCPDAPIALVDLVYRMLERDPQARIPSVRIVGAELEAILHRPETRSSHQRFQTPVSDNILLPNHNLPYEATPFVGRDVEIEEISNAIRQGHARLITLLGQGGMGKTRLSIKVAQNQLDYFTDGVYLVELAPLSDVNRIIPTIATATGCQLQDDGREQSQQLYDFLRPKQVLLIMDNYEHILDGAFVVDDLLKHTEHVVILATSRQPLALQGESVYALGGMDFPTSAHLDTAMGYSAVKLFVNRAKNAQSDFELTADNFAAVTTICRMAHGMPLGIVLAASWLAMLTPQEIVDELQSGIDILEDDMGEMPARQRSIRAVMNYSWEQMSPAERDVFMKLSVFRDGFTRAAAEEVAGAKLRILMTLSKKALLRRDSNSGRYVIHELLRQYAEEHLIESGVAAAVKMRHAEFFADLIATQIPFLKGQGQLQAINLIESELSNFITAWHHATDERHVGLIEKMLEGANLYGLFRGWNKQTYEAFHYTRHSWDVYANTDALLNTRLIIRFPDDGRDHVADLNNALAVAEKHEDALEVAHCKRQLGVILSHHRADMGGENSQRGITYLEAALQTYRDSDALFYAALAMDDLAWSLAVSGRMEDRKTLLAELVKLRRQIGDRVGLSRGANGVAASQDISEEIIATLTEGLEISTEMQDRYNIAWLSAMLGLHYRNHNDMERAERYCLNAMQLGEVLNIEQVTRFGQVNLLCVKIIQEHDLQQIEAELDSLFPNGIENYHHQPSVYFAGQYAYVSLYSLKGKGSEEQFRTSVANWISSGFGQEDIFWILPSVALWLAETDPESAFVYFKYAFKNEANGARWMRQSTPHMTAYDKLAQHYQHDSHPAVWERLEALDTPSVIDAVRTLVKLD